MKRISKRSSSTLLVMAIIFSINDYIYTNKAANFSKAKAYIAFKRSGKDIPYNQGGPLRLVYSNTRSWSKNLDAWNWSLRSIKVRTTG